MEWYDQGVLLSVRQHGETSAIIEVFTPEQGRHMGVVRGGASRKMAAMFQPGAQLSLHWRARLDSHIGVIQAEPLASRAALLADPIALGALGSICALLHYSLPERAPHAPLYHHTAALLDAMARESGASPSRSGAAWLTAYAQWELALLEEIGFGLDLTSCALSGARSDLAYVSPRTGRAVSRAAAGTWAPRLLPLPLLFAPKDNDQSGKAASRPEAQGEALSAVKDALILTEYFLTRALCTQLKGAALPEARARFVARLK